VIHHLGDERYGIWALVFSLVDYYAIVDFGFRSSVVKYAAHYRATGDLGRLDSLVSTGLVYFTSAAVVVIGAAVLIARNITRLFHILPRDESAFRFLTVTVGVGVALAIVFDTFNAVLEAYQRFDITARILILGNGLRATGCFAVIGLGWGLKAMGLCVLGSQIVTYLVAYSALRRLLPGRTFSPWKANLPMLREMLGYGVRTFTANVSLNVLNQAAPVLIGHFLSAAAVGYYVYPVRLLNYSVDLVCRLGLVTGSKAAELIAHGDIKTISRMAILVNRYCLMLFLPLAVYLVIFGRQLLEVWINPAFAANSAPLLPVLAAGVVVAVAAQFNSSAILYGLAKHGALARAVFLEAALCVGGLFFVIPRYGILAAACVVSGLMIASRGIYVPYWVSRHLGLSFSSYLWSIYARPLAIMTPIAAMAWILNLAAGAPSTWTAALGGGALMVACYYPVAFLFGLEPEHREMLVASAAGSRRMLEKVRLAGGAGAP
jgi:O-antigen/teichoic acid export membrane protein